MKIIIDIPEKTNAHIRSDYGHGVKCLRDEDREIVLDAIYNGIHYEESPHGEWILLKQGGVFCKNCKFTIPFRGSKPKYSFCPNCGADMREGEAE